MNLDLSDRFGQHVYATGEWEPATSAVVAELLGPGNCVLDVGANVGYFSLLASRRVGPNGRVIAFEPVPRIRSELCANLQMNHAFNVIVRDEAVSQTCGKADLFVGPSDHRGLSSMRALDNASERVIVNTLSIDSILPNDRRINLVKLDLEGAEYLAVLGMEECLRRDHPDLVVEVSPRMLENMGHCAEALCQRLLHHGYSMYMISDHDLLPISKWTNDLPTQFNALFSVREAVADWLKTAR